MKKLKDILKEQDLRLSKAERNAFLESVQEFEAFRTHIFRSDKLKEICENIGRLVEAADGFTVNETDGWFDEITVGRDTKRLKETYKLFEKTCGEIGKLQQRLEACYDDIGHGLNRYYKLNREI